MKCLTAQVRTDKLDLATVAVIEKIKRTFFLKDLQGNLICKSASIETIADAGRKFGRELGYDDVAYELTAV